jgi:hypothetical protein
VIVPSVRRVIVPLVVGMIRRVGVYRRIRMLGRGAVVGVVRVISACGGSRVYRLLRIIGVGVLGRGRPILRGGARQGREAEG